MIKRVAVFSLPETADPDEFWKYGVETHTAEVKELPGLRKYVINRVTKVVKGEPKFWGLAELWFDSEEAHHQAFTSSAGDSTREDFASRIAEHFHAWVEEKVII